MSRASVGSWVIVLGLFGAGVLPSPAQAQLKGQSYEQARQQMVDEEVSSGGLKNRRVIEAMRKTPRHEFVAGADAKTSSENRTHAYFDMSLPIGEHQTISAPGIVAYMTEQLDPQPNDRVLEIGTGSGYQAAVLSPLVKDVYTIEIVEKLGKRAAATLKRLKYTNVQCKIGDGYLGWPDAAPFDKIIVTCSPEKVPQALIDQLKEGGRMIVPVGERYEQVLYLFKKRQGKLETEALRPTLFVPMTGTAEEARQVKPDPLHPKLVNGGFEQLIESSGEPSGWYYIRQMKIVIGQEAPEGKNYVTFSNDVAGRSSRALQGFAIDGRKVHKLEVSCMVRGNDIRPGVAIDQLPAYWITFFDDDWKTIKRDFIGGGSWRGTYGWKHQSGTIKVPASARQAIAHIGLLGATGELSLDKVEVRAIDEEPADAGAQPPANTHKAHP